MTKKSWCLAAGSIICIGLTSAPALAKVSRVQISSRQPIADGRAFGDAGPYEEIRGRIYFEIDPAIAENQVITDLELAPRSRNGMVEMSADLSILTPVDAARGNGIALVDIVNRGRKLAFRLNHAQPGDEYGDGFLMNRGYTIVAVGWEFDVPPSPTAIRIEVPTTGGAPIGGLGFAAVRDTATWIKHSRDAIVSARYALAFGVSQSGRFLRTYLYLGFNTDESGRKVFDGVIAHIAGASRLDLNRRGAEPISLGMFSATSFPFADDALRDPVTGVQEGALDNPRSRANQPRIFYANTSVEYWGGGRVAALVHSTPDGKEDIRLPDNVRFYFLAGTQHGPGDFPPPPPDDTQQMRNPTDYWWIMRALLTAMEQWLTDDTVPPASVHPTIADGNLVAAARVRFPVLPNVKSPTGLTAGARAANPLLAHDGGAGAPLPLLVPQVDSDGNETSGIRHPEVAVPLATYTGWNFRKAGHGDPGELVPLAGSYVPFAATREERERSNDPRPSVEERYASRADYLQKVRAAGEDLIRRRYLLAGDLTPILERAGRHWDLIVERH